ncbi:MAG TPA: alpha/beta fold hydrolase [Candidatus Baltobacteraceae bacterium]|nr:alpha/beta fold hydrolase [Candidatus Baltobacteraceae bacterium]
MTVTLKHLQAEHNPVAVLEYEPRRARSVTIVAGHGYSSSKHNLDFLCSFLASHGYRVLSLDFPGHKLGSSGGTLRGIDDLVDAMGSVIAEAKRSGDAVYTMGHSMGAMTALFCAAHDSGIAGVVSITTGYGRPSALDALQKAGATDFRSSYVDGLALPDLVAHSTARFEEALPLLAGRPQLYVAASRDAMVSPRSVEDLYHRAPEPKTFVTIESDHTYAGENARTAVLQWLNERHPR